MDFILPRSPTALIHLIYIECRIALTGISFLCTIFAFLFSDAVKIFWKRSQCKHGQLLMGVDCDCVGPLADQIGAERVKGMSKEIFPWGIQPL